VVKGVDRLGPDAAEVMLTIRDLLARDIVIRALREGVDSSTPTGRAVLSIMASLVESGVTSFAGHTRRRKDVAHAADFVAH
jgi:DNA invertase Pin-like site-specific DNA recombinase